MPKLRKRVHGRIRVKTAPDAPKGQSAMEYLLTYSWALIIVALIMAIFFFLVYAPSIVVPSMCSFVSGAYCQDMVFGSNSVSSSVGLFLTNTQPYPILNPSITLNISGIGSMQGTCKPSLVAAGGAIICNVTIPQRAIAYGTLESGKLYLSAVPCPSGNYTACSTTPKQTYLGNFNSHVSPLLSSTSIVVSLSITNTTQAANGVPDKLIANVKTLGYPIAGATVTFKANQSFATIKPTPALTDSNGTAVAYVSSLTVGKVLVNASFAGVSAFQVVNFTEPVYVTFQTTLMPGAYTAVVSIDNTQFLYNQLPVTFSYARNSVHSYAFISPVSGPVNTRYVYSSISGCGLTAQSGSLTATKNCTVTASYATQYFLSMQAAPPTTNLQLIPGSEWLYSGSQVTISVVAPGYKFKKWVGTGSINYTGTSPTANVIMNTPISETAYVEQASTPPPPPPPPPIGPCPSGPGPSVGCPGLSGPGSINPSAYAYACQNLTAITGSITPNDSGYILTPGGSYNNLNTYYYYNLTPPMYFGPISNGTTYKFHIEAENMGGAAWFNNPIWFALGTSTYPSVGVIIDYDPCVAAANLSPRFGVVNGTDIIYPGKYLVKTGTSYTVGLTINSPTSVTVTINGVFTYTLNNIKPLNYSKAYIYAGGSYDQGWGGGFDNSASSPEGSFGLGAA